MQRVAWVYTYYRINPTMKKYVPRPQTTLEFERTIVTRYRTDSHCLAIELGCLSNINGNDRLCSCGEVVQKTSHIFTQCPITNSLGFTNYFNLQDAEDIHHMLLLVSDKLNTNMR